MPNQLIVVFVSGVLALVGIRVLISSFDDDENDSDGMSYPIEDVNYRRFIRSRL